MLDRRPGVWRQASPNALVGALIPVTQTGKQWSGRRQPLPRKRACVVIVLLILSACSNIRSPADKSNEPRVSVLEVSSQVPALVSAPDILAAECVAAALRLGYPVPCPRIVPLLSGVGMSCPQPAGAATSLPCVGLEGSPPYLVFYLEFTGFVVPPGYVGVDGKTDGHVTLEARLTADSPPQRCIGATFLGTVKVGHWMTKEYVCPNDSLPVEREARNGQGAYVGHLALEWQVSGTEYIVTAHGHTTANLTLLKRLGGSIKLIAPR